MSVFDSLSPPRPTADMGAMRVKRAIAQAFQQLESTLMMVHHIMDQHGREEVQQALGDDAREVEQLYGSLKATLESCKPGCKLPEYPK